MDIEKEIKTLVRSAIMEEIDNLGIRAVVRERIENAGFSRDEIRKIIKECADSYFRSAMNGGIEVNIRRLFDEKIAETVSKTVENAASDYSGWRGRDALKKMMDEEIRRHISAAYDVNVELSLTKKSETK